MLNHGGVQAGVGAALLVTPAVCRQVWGPRCLLHRWCAGRCGGRAACYTGGVLAGVGAAPLVTPQPNKVPSPPVRSSQGDGRRRLGGGRSGGGRTQDIGEMHSGQVEGAPWTGREVHIGHEIRDAS